MGYQIQYPWTAIFKDGSTLTQFNSDNSENLFRLVLDRQDDLVKFTVGPITVDLSDGSFTVGGLKLYGSSNADGYEEWGINEKIPKRLIYFRRVKRTFDAQSLDQSSIYIVYCVGWQATVDFHNVQHVMYLHPDGSIVFR